MPEPTPPQPETGTPQPAPADIPDLTWQALNHRQALTELITRGWTPTGAGDWAIGLRSPDATHLARVCPFDPAYPAFVDLCRRCAGNPWLPAIALFSHLEGGGNLTILEYLEPVDDRIAEHTAKRWRDDQDTADPHLDHVRQSARTIDEQCRASIPWWDGLDLNSAHIRTAADGRIVLIDIFCMNGAALYGSILEDVNEVHRRLPRERMRHALEIPYIARESSTAEINALKKAWAA